MHLHRYVPFSGQLQKTEYSCAMRATIPENESHIFRYLYTVLLYMPDYKNEPAGIEKLLPWSDFIKERCSGLMLKIKHLNTMNQCLFKAKDTKGAVGNTVDYSSLTVA